MSGCVCVCGCVCEFPQWWFKLWGVMLKECLRSTEHFRGSWSSCACRQEIYIKCENHIARASRYMWMLHIPEKRQRRYFVYLAARFTGSHWRLVNCEGHVIDRMSHLLRKLTANGWQRPTQISNGIRYVSTRLVPRWRRMNNQGRGGGEGGAGGAWKIYMTYMLCIHRRIQKVSWHK